MQTVNTLWRVAGRRRFLLGGIAAALCIHAGCGKPITYERLPVGTGEEAGVGPTVDGGDDLPAAPDGPGSGGAAGLGGLNGSGGAGTAGATGAGDGGLGTGGRTGTGGTGPGTGGSTGTGGSPGTGGATGTGGAIGTGGRTGTGGATGTGGGGGGDVAQFNFETSNQGWASQGAWTGVAPTTAQRFAGQSSFGGTLVYTPIAGGTLFELGVVFPQPPVPVAGNTVTFHIFLPVTAGGILRWIQPYIQDATLPTHQFVGAYTDSFLTFGGWNTLSVTIPAGFVSPIFKLAVQFHVDGTVAYSGNVYVDAISW